MSVPIQERIYYPYADLRRPLQRSQDEETYHGRYRTMRVISPHSPLPAGRTAIFSVLAPEFARNSYFSGTHLANRFGPKDLPTFRRATGISVFDVLKRTRHSIVGFIQRIKACLAIGNSRRSSLLNCLIHSKGKSACRKHSTGKCCFISPPTFNPLITRKKQCFCEVQLTPCHRFHHDDVAYAIDSMLRSPQLDVHVCVNLLACGSLDDPRREHVGWKFLEEYERSAQGINSPTVTSLIRRNTPGWSNLCDTDCGASRSIPSLGKVYTRVLQLAAMDSCINGHRFSHHYQFRTDTAIRYQL